MREFVIRAADPRGGDVRSLLRLAAAEARQLYPDLFDAGAPEPTNAPTHPLGVYLLADLDGEAVAMGAHMPLDAHTTEVRRMYVRADVRRLGAARTILEELERHAQAAGFSALRLETGCRQAAAMRLYEAHGFKRIEPFGPYIGDPTSVCFEKLIAAGAEGGV